MGLDNFVVPEAKVIKGKWGQGSSKESKLSGTKVQMNHSKGFSGFLSTVQVSSKDVENKHIFSCRRLSDVTIKGRTKMMLLRALFLPYEVIFKEIPAKSLKAMAFCCFCIFRRLRK